MSPASLCLGVRRGLLVALIGVAGACGGPQSQPSAPADDSGAESSSQQGGPGAEADARGESGSSGAHEDESLEGKYEVADATPREVRYLVKPDGLQIDIEGARFRPRAEAFRVGGGWGVRLEVEAISTDDETHALLSTETGALAFAGTVKRRSKEQRFGDRRQGGEAQMLFPAAATTLTREWPGNTGQAPLRAGDELKLEVGLWGLGADTESRRPVTKFFLVRMSVGAKQPKPLITPPETL